MKAAFDQIISDFNRSSENFVATKRETKWKKPMLVSILIAIVIVIVLSITISLIIKDRDNGEDSTTILTTTETTLSTSSSVSDSTTVTSATTSSTTETPLPQAKLLKRDAWVMKGLELSGKLKQLKPIERILILKTETDSCDSEPSCVDFMFEHQQNAYPEFDDVEENFLISSEGTVYEGRGFSREGQTTHDSRTSYNGKAVSISFLSSGSSLSEEQQTAFCVFIDNMLASGDLDESFLIFQHNDLKSSFYDQHEDILIEGCELHLMKRKTYFE